jgi:enamine deaminase RidA (YjgF/YER057c/UK114 family)
MCGPAKFNKSLFFSPNCIRNFVQTERAPPRALAACEAVARLRREVGAPLAVLNPEGLPREAGQSQVALVGASRVVLSGSQVSFGFAEADARLAFERLEKSLEQAGASTRGVAFAEYYALSSGIAEQVRKVRGEFFDAARPPAGSLEPVEGLPAMDAGFAIDVVAVKWGTTLISVKRRLISGPNQARRDALHSASGSPKSDQRQAGQNAAHLSGRGPKPNSGGRRSDGRHVLQV